MSSRSTYFVILLPRSMSLIATCGHHWLHVWYQTSRRKVPHRRQGLLQAQEAESCHSAEGCNKLLTSDGCK
jgi:hypothetical protein